jgi:zinc protease
MTDDGLRSASAVPRIGPGRIELRKRRAGGVSLAKIISLALCLGWGLAAPAPRESGVFPYAPKVETLENGLRIVSVSLPHPNVIAYSTIVRSGSRNEIEPGKSGFARLFTRLMSEGTKQVPKAAYDEFLTRLGARTNATAADDFTCFDVVFAGRDNLEKVVRTEADRFINPAYTEDSLKTGAAVIEGEYNAGAADPQQRLIEALRDTAFDRHSYKHTVRGDLKDIRDLPNQYGYSLLYKKRFYAPDNTIILAAGDFDPAALAALVRKYYGAWEKSNFDLRTPVEPPQDKARRARVDWPAPALARIAVGYHGPAFSDTAADKAALDLLAELFFGPASPLYQKLVDRDRTCLSLAADFPDTRDPSLLVISAAVNSDPDLPAVEAEILKEIERAKAEPVPLPRLADVKSRRKYGLARALETTEGVAGTLAFYLNLTGDPGTVKRLFDICDKITARDIQDAARKYFKPSNSTTVTLSGGGAK